MVKALWDKASSRAPFGLQVPECSCYSRCSMPCVPGLMHTLQGRAERASPRLANKADCRVRRSPTAGLHALQVPRWHWLYSRTPAHALLSHDIEDDRSGAVRRAMRRVNDDIVARWGHPDCLLSAWTLT